MLRFQLVQTSMDLNPTKTTIYTIKNMFTFGFSYVSSHGSGSIKKNPGPQSQHGSQHCLVPYVCMTLSGSSHIRTSGWGHCNSERVTSLMPHSGGSRKDQIAAPLLKSLVRISMKNHHSA